MSSTSSLLLTCIFHGHAVRQHNIGSVWLPSPRLARTSPCKFLMFGCLLGPPSLSTRMQKKPLSQARQKRPSPTSLLGLARLMYTAAPAPAPARATHGGWGHRCFPESLPPRLTSPSREKTRVYPSSGSGETRHGAALLSSSLRSRAAALSSDSGSSPSVPPPASVILPLVCRLSPSCPPVPPSLSVEHQGKFMDGCSSPIARLGILFPVRPSPVFSPLFG